MRTGISITLKPRPLPPSDHSVAGDRNAPHKHVWRAEIVLLRRTVSPMGLCAGPASRRTVCGGGRNASCRRVTTASYKTPPCASHRRNFLHMSQLLGALPGLDARRGQGLLDRPPTMARKPSDGSASSVQRIWRTHGLQPHRVHQFKLSNDPKSIDKLRMLSGFMSIRPPMPSSSRSTKSRKSIELPRYDRRRSLAASIPAALSHGPKSAPVA